MSRLDISPEEFVRLLDQDLLGDALVIDVREKHEWEYYHLEPSVWMPMNTIPERLEELPRDKELFIICAHGVRSVSVCNYLLHQSITNIRNVQGGMSAVSGLRGFQYD